MVTLIDPNTSALVSLALDAAGMRQQAISHNIANANTPGYKPLSVSFEEQFSDIRNSIAQGQTPSLSSLSNYRPVLEFAHNGSEADEAVSLDMEVAKLSENTLHHQALLKALNRHFSILSMAITEGKR